MRTNEHLRCAILRCPNLEVCDQTHLCRHHLGMFEAFGRPQWVNYIRWSLTQTRRGDESGWVIEELPIKRLEMCAVLKCERIALCQHLCAGCYRIWIKHGSPVLNLPEGKRWLAMREELRSRGLCCRSPRGRAAMEAYGFRRTGRKSA